MARIRTIKPEFPQSESMGRVSRDARLCFLLLFTLSDDHGKLRGNSRMLASLLYPYDDDAPRLIVGWLDELVKEGCIVRYAIGADQYIKIINWESHQKVDRPSASKIPEPREASRELPEASRAFPVGSEDQGSEDQGKDQRKGVPPPDYESMVRVWNETAGTVCPRVEKLTDARKTSLRKRLADTFEGSMEKWKDYCVSIQNCCFLAGENKQGWRADFDWALSPSNAVKVMEGKYLDNSNTQQKGLAHGKPSRFAEQDYRAGTDGFDVT